MKNRMEHFNDLFTKIPAQAVYVIIAISGGVARYFNSFATGQMRFSVGIFLASAFAAGFSGMMFALLGDSLHMPYPLPHIMAGVGGFFGDQTMKFLLEYFTKRGLGEAPK